MSRPPGRPRRLWVFPAFVLVLALLSACAQRGAGKQPPAFPSGSGARLDNVFIAKIPGHRVGGGVKRVVLLGRGEMGETNVRGMRKAFEGIGGVEAVVPTDQDARQIGAMLEDDAMPPGALDRLKSCCNADHLLWMVSSLTPHEGYEHGGMAVFRVEAKIFDLSTGAVRYETARSLGVEFPSPGESGMAGAHVPPLSAEWISILDLVVMSELSYELTYAFGGTHDGTIPYSAMEGICLVASVLKGSPADLAGIRMNDTILRKGETAVQDSSSCRFARFAQGSTVPYRISRDRTEMEVWLSFPAIPAP